MHIDKPSPPTAGDVFIAAAITLALFLPLSAADLYLSADRSGILPVNATVISFVALSSTFGLILLVGLARDRGRHICSYYVSAGPILVVLASLTILQLSEVFLPRAGDGKVIFLALYSFVMFCFSLGIGSHRAFQRYHRAILAVCLFGAAGSILFDVAYPQTFVRTEARPAGFQENPNHAAAIVVMLVVATVDWTRSRTSDMLLWLIAAVAAVATLSRGGMILLAVAFLPYAVVTARSEPNRFLRNLILLLVAAGGVAVVYLATDLGTTVYSSDNRRVLLLQRLFSGDTTMITQDSRVALAYRYIDLISERPWLGYGTGFVASQPKGPHNMLLTLWVENGILGLLAYTAVLVASFWHFRRLADPRGQSFCVVLLAISVFTHNLLDERPGIVTLGLLSGMAFSQALARTKSAEAATPRPVTSLRVLQHRAATHPTGFVRGAFR